LSLCAPYPQRERVIFRGIVLLWTQWQF